MAASEQRAKDSTMAAHLKAQGYPHGRRRSNGVSNVPSMTEVGSAAHRRRRP